MILSPLRLLLVAYHLKWSKRPVKAEFTRQRWNMTLKYSNKNWNKSLGALKMLVPANGFAIFSSSVIRLSQALDWPGVVTWPTTLYFPTGLVKLSTCWATAKFFKSLSIQSRSTKFGKPRCSCTTWCLKYEMAIGRHLSYETNIHGPKPCYLLSPTVQAGARKILDGSTVAPRRGHCQWSNCWVIYMCLKKHMHLLAAPEPRRVRYRPTLKSKRW